MCQPLGFPINPLKVRHFWQGFAKKCSDQSWTRAGRFFAFSPGRLPAAAPAAAEKRGALRLAGHLPAVPVPLRRLRGAAAGEDPAGRERAGGDVQEGRWGKCGKWLNQLKCWFRRRAKQIDVQEGSCGTGAECGRGEFRMEPKTEHRDLAGKWPTTMLKK